MRFTGVIPVFTKFLKDRRGNFATITAIVSVPLLGAVALGVDYTEMSRQRSAALNALDAAGIAAARRAVEGATEEELIAYAKDFFNANLNSLDPAKAKVKVTLPTSEAGGGTLKMAADFKYEPYFFGAFMALLGKAGGELVFHAETEIQLKNTLEVALVLDNSGSMDYNGSGTGKKRMVLLKEAAKQLVDTIAQQAVLMKQVDKPVQFALVPFAASVNVGSQYKTAAWMDVDGRSPIHHENFDWTTMPSNRKVQLSGGVYYKQGDGWGSEAGQKVTRFTMFDDLKRITSESESCSGRGRNRTCTTTYSYGSYAEWGGCVETRPHPYAYDNTPPSTGTPATLFVPMFAPDETDLQDSSRRRAMGNWWDDVTSSSSSATRQKYMPKYFEPAPYGTGTSGMYEGPNGMCSTKPITPLTDVSTQAGLKTIKDAIDDMESLGATDVPEGTAWGWRTLSSKAPFTDGRPDHEKGNDKVLIVLTDGENTYYTPNSLGYNDLAGNKSVYSNKGYTNVNYNGGNKTRLFMGSTVSSSSHNNGNFSAAMNQHMDTVCEAAKAAGVIVMTVALDLSKSDSGEKAAIEALTRCASDSRYRKDPDDPGKAAKLFWNANGSNLADKFREIAEELSNLRIIG